MFDEVTASRFVHELLELVCGLRLVDDSCSWRAPNQELSAELSELPQLVKDCELVSDVVLIESPALVDHVCPVLCILVDLIALAIMWENQAQGLGPRRTPCL